MNGARPGLLGRAAAPDAFCDLLLREKQFSTMGRARAAIRRWTKLSQERTPRSLRNVPLGKYIMWATYAEADRHGNPFHVAPFRGVGADEIRDRLGLGMVPEHEPLLLFVYGPPDDLDLLFPTVADAQRNWFFRPAPDDPDVESGRTEPLTPGKEPQPEVVHEPVRGETLRRPIEERLP